ncbi:MAG: hypothetical protein ENTB_04848 [Enterocloster aldenensis]
MSDIWIPYGGGADLDPVTATAADVRKGKTIVDKDGNPISGTMPDIAGRTITPTTSQQTLNGGGYLTGNVVVPGFTPPSANVIKKGYVLNLFGIKITGSWEGYVPISTDLYYKGANTANFKFGAVLGYKQNGSVAFDTAQITCETGTGGVYACSCLYPSAAYNLTPYSSLKVDFRKSLGGIDASATKLLYGASLSVLSEKPVIATKSGDTLSFDISSINATRYLALYLYGTTGSATFYLDRIYFT